MSDPVPGCQLCVCHDSDVILTNAQVPKYQKLTAVLYDEDYGGDDEVSHSPASPFPPSTAFDACAGAASCGAELAAPVVSLPYVIVPMLCHCCGTDPMSALDPCLFNHQAAVA